MDFYSAFGSAVCIAMLVSGYKSFRSPDSYFYRVATWSSAALLGVVLFVDSVVGIVPRKPPQVTIEAETLAATMKDTEQFLMRLPDVKHVAYSSDKGTLKINVTVLPTMSDETVAEFKDEIAREFLHNLVDECDNPADVSGGGVVYKVNIERADK